MRVDVPEYNTFVDFPDDTPPEQIQGILQKGFPSKAQPKTPGLLDKLKSAIGEGALLPGEMQGGVDDTEMRQAKGMITSGLATMPIAGLGGLYGLLSGRGAQKTMEDVANALTYEPETIKAKIMGEEGSRALMSPFEGLVRAVGGVYESPAATPEEMTPLPEAGTFEENPILRHTRPVAETLALLSVMGGPKMARGAIDFAGEKSFRNLENLLQPEPTPTLRPTPLPPGIAPFNKAEAFADRLAGAPLIERNIPLTNEAVVEGLRAKFNENVLRNIEDRISADAQIQETQRVKGILDSLRAVESQGEPPTLRMKGKEVYPEEIKMPEGVESKTPIPEQVRPEPKPTEEFLRGLLDKMSAGLRESEGTVRQPVKLNDRDLKAAKRRLPYYPKETPTEAEISILQEASRQGKLDPQEKAILDRITGKVERKPVEMETPTPETESVEPGAYMGQHRPMTVEGGAGRLHDLEPTFGPDIYGDNAIQYFGTGEKALDIQTLRILKAVKGKPEADVTIYRAIPKDAPTIYAVPGDWVTVNKKYAQEHGEGILGGDFKIIEQKVKAKDLTTNADSFHEQGYYPEEPGAVKEVTPEAKGKDELTPMSEIEKQMRALPPEEVAKLKASGVIKPQADMGVLDIPKKMEALEKKKGKKGTGPQNAETRIMSEGGIKIDESYNTRLLRQSGNKKLYNQKTAKYTPDEWAQILTDEGYKGVETGDKLIQAAESGELRKVFTPELLDDKIEAEIRKLENEHIERELENYKEEALNRGAIPEVEARLKDDISNEIATEGVIHSEEAALSELEDFFSSVTKPAEETPKVSKKTVSQETASIPGTTHADTFNLVNPETKMGRLPEESVTKTADMFGKEKPTGEMLKEKAKKIKGGKSILSNERGSLGDLSASETVKALRNLTDNIKEAMPHLENLGRRVYQEGFRTAKEWARQMKTYLSDTWNNFKGHLSTVFEAVKKYAKSEKGSIEFSRESLKKMEELQGDIVEKGKPEEIKAKVKEGIKGESWETMKGIGDLLTDEEKYGVKKTIAKSESNDQKVKTLGPAAREVKNVWSEVKETADEYLGAISTRLGNIHPSLKNTLRKFELKRGLKTTELIDRALPFIEKVSKMPKEDKATFDLARKNGDKAEIDRIVDKYNLRDDYEKVRTILEGMYQDAKNVGYEVGYRPNYHPRVLKDTRGFLEYFYQHEKWPVIEKAIRETENKLQRYLSEDEKARLINSMLRGYPNSHISLTRPGQLKARTVETITPEINQFYMDSDGALLRYINDVTDAIEARKLFGKGPKGGKIGNLEDTIGGYVLDLLNKGKLKPEHERPLTDILNARFNEVGTRGIFGLYKNASYIDTMGSPISAITQIGDLAWALYKNGVGRTLESTGKAIIGKSQFKKEDIGISRIAQEFADTSKMARAVTKVFKVIGLEKIDNIGKEALINSTFKAAQKKSLSDRGTAELRKELKPIFEGETEQLIKDIKAGVITENVKLYLFNTLSDFQPISLSEMPQKYLTAGNGRIFYMLKSFTLKQFDAYRREVFQKIKTPGERTEGIKNLVKLTGCFAAANATADVIKDIMLGRPINPDDKVVDNMLRLLGISKFVTWKAREEGAGSALVRQIMPPFKAIDAITKDIAKVVDYAAETDRGKQRVKGIKLREGLEITQSIPVVGKLYYWWFGKGTAKSERQEKKMKQQKPETEKLLEKLKRAM